MYFEKQMCCPFCAGDEFESACACAKCGMRDKKSAMMIFPYKENGAVRWLDCCLFCASAAVEEKQRTALEQAAAEEFTRLWE